jgi:hypothetical protein
VERIPPNIAQIQRSILPDNEYIVAFEKGVQMRVEAVGWIDTKQHGEVCVCHL